MKYLRLILTCALTCAAVLTVLQRTSVQGENLGESTKAEGIWERDLAIALERAKKEDKLILMDIYADWCPPCKQMERDTFTDPDVLTKLGSYIPLKVNADHDVETSMKYGTGSLPTLVVLNPEGLTLVRRAGYHSPEKFVELLSHADDGKVALSALQQIEDQDYAGARQKLAALANASSNPRLAEFARQQLDLLQVVGHPAPELKLDNWVQGEATTLGALRGKVVLVDFLQMICPGCHATRPRIQHLQERYEKEGLVVLGVAVAFEHQDVQQPHQIRSYVKEQGYTYPVGIDRDLTSTFRSYNAGGTPWTVLIDRSGIVRLAAFFDEERIEESIKTLLAEDAVSATSTV